jgi:hypothetical protein
MSAINTISAEKLLRLIGTPACPAIIDVRSHAEVQLIRDDETPAQP